MNIRTVEEKIELLAIEIGHTKDKLKDDETKLHMKQFYATRLPILENQLEAFGDILIGLMNEVGEE